MKLPVGFHVDGVHLTAQLGQELRHDHAAGASTAIERHAEAARANAGHVEVGQRQHLIDVSLDGVGVMHDVAERVPGCARNTTVHQRAHVRAFIGREKEPRRPDELECVPLDRIVAGRDAEAAGRVVVFDGQLDGGSGCHTDVDHGAANRLQCAVHNAREHRSGDSTVTSDDDRASALPCGPSAKGGGEGRDDFRSQPVAHTSAHTGHTHHQSFESHHIPRNIGVFAGVPAS